MGIIDDLRLVDEQLNKDLYRLDQDRFEQVEKTLEEERREKAQREKERKALKAEKIQGVLDDREEGIDEPHMYSIRYAHSGYDYVASLVAPGPIKKEAPGVKDLRVIMTEREKRIMEISVGMEEFVRSQAQLRS